MGFIIGLLLAIAIIYRIYVTGQQMIELMKKPEFWIGAMFFISYVYVSYLLLKFLCSILDKVFNCLPDPGQGDILNLVYILIYLAIAGAFIGFMGYIYHTILCKKYPILKLPVQFTILVLSLGLIAFKLYNMNNSNLASNSSDSNNSSFVDPHQVSGYDRADGTHVDGYWRDGDGNTSINLTKEDGGGYFRS